MRVLPVLLIPAVSSILTFLLVQTIGGRPPRLPFPLDEPISPFVLVAVGVAFLASVVVLLRLGRPNLLALLFIAGWTLITALASAQGGVASVWPALLVIPICAAGLVIDGVASLSLAALATVMVSSLGLAELSGLPVGPSADWPFSPNGRVLLTAFGYWAGLFWTVALLTSILAGGLQRALQRTREQAQALSDLSAGLETRVAAQTAELAQRAGRAEALYEVSRALTSTLDLDQVLALIAEQAGRLLKYDSVQVLIRQPDGHLSVLGAYGLAMAFPDGLYSLEATIADSWESRQPHIVTLPGSTGAGGESGRLALMLSLSYGTSLAGVLMLSNADGSAASGPDDLILGQGFADQVAVAIANAQLLNQVRQAATFQERARLARDIHDTLAQGLAGVIVQLGAAQRALRGAPKEAPEHLALAQRMARESLAEARRSVWNLRASALQRGDLGDALRALTVRPLGTATAVTFEQRGEPQLLPTAVESTLLRVCQEALVNVSKHAGATQAAVTLEYAPDGVRLSVHDNGVGFNPSLLEDMAMNPEAGLWSGFGLLGMRERIVALGGTLQVSNDGGARILALVPLATAAIALAQSENIET